MKLSQIGLTQALITSKDANALHSHEPAIQPYSTYFRATSLGDFFFSLFAWILIFSLCLYDEMIIQDMQFVKLTLSSSYTQKHRQIVKHQNDHIWNKSKVCLTKSHSLSPCVRRMTVESDIISNFLFIDDFIRSDSRFISIMKTDTKLNWKRIKTAFTSRS